MTSLRANLRTYIAIAQFAIRDRWYHSRRLLARLLMVIIRVAVLLLLYKLAFATSGENIVAIDFRMAAWSMGIYFIVFSIQFRKIFHEINRDIETGNIEMLLVKPFHYIWYRVSLQLGWGSIDFIATSVIGVALLLGMVGLPVIAFSWQLAAVILVLFLGGLLAGVLIYALIGLSSFWLINAQPVNWLVDKFVMLFGGAYIPVALFPETFRTIIEYTPFGVVNFVTQAVYPETLSRAWELIGVQVFWIIALLITMRVVYRRAQRKLAIQGG